MVTCDHRGVPAENPPTPPGLARGALPAAGCPPTRRRQWRLCSALKVTPQGRWRMSCASRVPPATGPGQVPLRPGSPCRPLPAAAPRGAGGGARGRAGSAVGAPYPAAALLVSPPERSGRLRREQEREQGRQRNGAQQRPADRICCGERGPAGRGRGGNTGNGRARVRAGARTGVRERAQTRPQLRPGKGRAGARTHLPGPAGRSSGERRAARTHPARRYRRRWRCRSPPPPPSLTLRPPARPHPAPGPARGALRGAALVAARAGRSPRCI